MARFGKFRRMLDPRVPFSLEPGSSIFDLSNGLQVLIAYNQPTMKPREFMTGLDMQDVLSTDVMISTIPNLFGNPVGWKTTKTGFPNIVPGNFTVGQWVTHGAEEMSLSFWYRNDAAAPISSPPISLSNHVFVSTDSTVLNFNAPPTRSKFTVFSKDSPGNMGEELAIGWNNNPPGAPKFYLSTRNALTYKTNPYTIGDEGFMSDDMSADQPETVLKYGVWHHIVITIKMGKTFLPSGIQGGSNEFGSSAVYVDGKLVNTYVGYTKPGDSSKPWGSSIVEKYSRTSTADYSKLAPTKTDRLWFPYNPATNNRSYYQYSAWNRVLSPEEVAALYNGCVKGVFVDSTTSYSAPPRKQRVGQSRIVKTINLGFDDSQGPKSSSPYNDNRAIPDYMQVSLGSNAIVPADGVNTRFFGGVDNNSRTDIREKVPARLAAETLNPLPNEYTQAPYTERLDKKDLACADGTTGMAVVRIPINSVSSSVNFQIAGRTDSKMADTVSTTTVGSLFMSSAFRHNTDAYNYVVSGKPTGIAGTGFMYYSPRFKTWVEKRTTNWTVIGNTVDDMTSERYDAVNAIEVNAATSDEPNIHDIIKFKTAKITHFPPPPFFDDVLYPANEVLPQSQYDVAAYHSSQWISFPPPGTGEHSGSADHAIPPTSKYFLSASFSSHHFVTGVNEVMAQFTSSPQAGYFLPFKEHLEHLGYPSIGTPTTAFGAPFSPRYHANDTETIKMSEFIDRPFRLKKVIVKLPVKVIRRNDIEETGLSSGFDFEWAKNVQARKDLDNYVFFLYRQIRSNVGDKRDSPTDVSSSIRFLIASSSVCVYNSPSFGRAFSDGFSDIFGQNTPIVTSGTVGPIDTSLNELYNSCLTDGKDPLTGQSLTYWNRPLHTPSVEIDAELNDFSVGSQTYERSMMLHVEMTPAVTLGGMSNASLMYVTTSTGMHSTSFWYGENGSGVSALSGRNQLFNRYPYTGTFASPNDKNAVPPITTVFQNFWLGGTRQPIVNNNAKNFNELTASTDASLRVAPYFAFMSNDAITYTSRSQWFNGKTSDEEAYFDPNFDNEIGRTGISVGTVRDNIFTKPVGIVTDGRSITTAFSDKATTKVSAVFQRTNLITFEGVQYENLDTMAAGAALYLTDSRSSIGTLTGSNMADLVSSFTTGYFVASPNTNKQTQRDYILLPTDELVLGLDAGISPPPDITPTYDDPHPDALGGIDPILVITIP